MQLKQALEASFPGVEVRGLNYPVTATKVCLLLVSNCSRHELLLTALADVHCRRDWRSLS